MNKALCISAAIAMALSGAALAKGPTQSKSDCDRLTVPGARTACMGSTLRSDSSLDTVNRATGSGGLWHGPGQPKAATSADTSSRPNAGIDPSGAGGTSGAGAQAEGRLDLRSDIEIMQSGPDAHSSER